MPTSKSARKRMRQDVKRRMHNRVVKSAVRTQVRKFLAALESGDAEAALRGLRAAARALDKAVARGVIHKRTAARRKSRLAGKLNQLTTPTPQA